MAEQETFKVGEWVHIPSWKTYGKIAYIMQSGDDWDAIGVDAPPHPFNADMLRRHGHDIPAIYRQGVPSTSCVHANEEDVPPEQVAATDAHLLRRGCHEKLVLDQVRACG